LKKTWSIVIELVRDCANRSFEDLDTQINELIKSEEKYLEKDWDSVSFVASNNLMKLIYKQFEKFWRLSHQYYSGDLSADFDSSPYFTEVFHPPTGNENDSQFAQSCQGLFAYITFGTLPSSQEIGTVIGMKRTPNTNGDLFFISDVKKSEYQLLSESWKVSVGVEEKKAYILRLFDICCYLRKVGISLDVLSCDNLAINRKTKSLKLVWLKRAEFVGLEDENTKISGPPRLSIVLKTISDILNWDNTDGEVNPNLVLPKLVDLMILNGTSLDYRDFLKNVDEIRALPNRWNALSIDGGGARGIVSAMILNQLEQRILNLRPECLCGKCSI
jgi:hypothetical protein